jgi:hypothetical protein
MHSTNDWAADIPLKNKECQETDEFLNEGNISQR